MKKDKKKTNRHANSAIVRESAPAWMLPLILIAAFIVFSPALKNDMINTWDDGLYITDNLLTDKLNAENIKAIFTQPVGNNYNPLPILVFALIRSTAGLDPFLYHLINILFHLLCVALVFRLVCLLDKKIFTAFIITALFAIHPMRVESVAWITELKDVMFASFYFAALIIYVLWLRGDRRNVLLFISMLVLATLSLLSKIQAVSLPLSMLLIDYLEKRPVKVSLIIEKIPFFVLSAASGILGIYFLQTGGSLIINEKVSLADRFFYGCYSLGNYFMKFILPINLSAYYPYPEKENGILPTLYYVVPVLLILGAFLVYKKFRASRAVIFGLLFFLANIVFVLQVVGAGKAFMADRFTYVAYFGLFFLTANVFQNFIERKQVQAAFVKGAVIAYVLIMAVMSYQRTMVWKNSETLWTDCIEKYPRADVAYDNRGIYYRSIKQNQKALSDYNMVLKINPRYPLTYNNRGNVYFDNGQDDLALADYNKAIALDSTQVKTYTNRALIYLRKQENAKAEKDFEKALSLNANYAMVYFNRGLYFDAINANEKAAADFTRYLQMKPADDGIHNSLGISYQKMNQHQKAIECFLRANQLNPAEPVYLENLAYSEYSFGQMENARKNILKARQMGLQPDPAFLQRLGL
jgi:protein O-mannosyl-transferase